MAFFTTYYKYTGEVGFYEGFLDLALHDVL